MTTVKTTRRDFLKGLGAVAGVLGLTALPFKELWIPKTIVPIYAEHKARLDKIFNSELPIEDITHDHTNYFSRVNNIHFDGTHIRAEIEIDGSSKYSVGDKIKIDDFHQTGYGLDKDNEFIITDINMEIDQQFPSTKWDGSLIIQTGPPEIYPRRIRTTINVIGISREWTHEHKKT